MSAGTNRCPSCGARQAFEQQTFAGELITQSTDRIDLPCQRSAEDIRSAIVGDVTTMQIAESAAMADFGLTKASR